MLTDIIQKASENLRNYPNEIPENINTFDFFNQLINFMATMNQPRDKKQQPFIKLLSIITNPKVCAISGSSILLKRWLIDAQANDIDIFISLDNCKYPKNEVIDLFNDVAKELNEMAKDKFSLAEYFDFSENLMIKSSSLESYPIYKGFYELDTYRLQLNTPLKKNKKLELNIIFYNLLSQEKFHILKTFKFHSTLLYFANGYQELFNAINHNELLDLLQTSKNREVKVLKNILSNPLTFISFTFHFKEFQYYWSFEKNEIRNCQRDFPEIIEKNLDSWGIPYTKTKKHVHDHLLKRYSDRIQETYYWMMVVPENRNTHLNSGYLTFNRMIERLIDTIYVEDYMIHMQYEKHKKLELTRANPLNAFYNKLHSFESFYREDPASSINLNNISPASNTLILRMMSTKTQFFLDEYTWLADKYLIHFADKLKSYKENYDFEYTDEDILLNAIYFLKVISVMIEMEPLMEGWKKRSLFSKNNQFLSRNTALFNEIEQFVKKIKDANG